METAAKHNLNELGYFDGTSKMSFLEGLASYQRVIKDKQKKVMIWHFILSSLKMREERGLNYLKYP